jgi:hypothetical protein
LNYAKRGGIGSPGKLLQIIKKKIKFGRLLSNISEKKRVFVERITASLDDFQTLSNLFSELQTQYQEMDRSTKELCTLIVQASPLPL